MHKDHRGNAEENVRSTSNGETQTVLTPETNRTDHITLRRAVMRVQPDGIHPELFQVIELANDPRDIAETIAVRVVERGRVDLVDESFLPPGAFVLVRVAVHGKSGILALGVGEGDVLRHRETVQVAG